MRQKQSTISYHWLERHILTLLRIICMQQHLLVAVLGLFHPFNASPSSSQITTSLRTTLCWRRPWSTKGSSWRTSELCRWNILVRIKCRFLYSYCGSGMNCWYSCLFFDRFTFEDLLPTRLLWFTSLWTAGAGVCTLLYISDEHR